MIMMLSQAPKTEVCINSHRAGTRSTLYFWGPAHSRYSVNSTLTQLTLTCRGNTTKMEMLGTVCTENVSHE